MTVSPFVTEGKASQICNPYTSVTKTENSGALLPRCGVILLVVRSVALLPGCAVASYPSDSDQYQGRAR